MKHAIIRPLSPGDEEYLRDESKRTGHAEAIAFPETEAQIIEILREASRAGTPVTIQGSRTGLAAAAVPFGGLVLNLSRMDKVTGLRQENGRFFLTVQPGVILQKLNKAIAARAFDSTSWTEAARTAYQAFTKAPVQMFTPDPTETTASIGGMAACNASGARSYRYGPTRSHITAIRGVLADGQTFSLRRGQVFAQKRTIALETEQGGVIHADLPTYEMPHCKNASGYFIHDGMDALDLFIGSDGTLAVLTELELSLLPLPALMWGVMAFFQTQEQAVAYTRLVRTLSDRIASIEYFDSFALQILRRQKAENTAFSGLPYLPSEYGCAVYTELHCSREDEAYTLLEGLSDCCTRSGGDPDHTWVAANDSDRDLLYFFRHAVPESVNMQVERYKHDYPEITKVGGDLAVPDEAFAALLRLYDETLSAEGLEHAAWGHIGNNHIHVNILPHTAEQYHRGKALLARWAAEAARLGGAVSAEHGVGKLKAPFLEVMYGMEHIQEMAALKRAFDPNGLLGRGNLFSQEVAAR